MDLSLIAIHFSDVSWITFALVFGLAASLISLPPMVGYLAAGFVLSALGIQSSDTLNSVADIGTAHRNLGRLHYSPVANGGYFRGYHFCFKL